MATRSWVGLDGSEVAAWINWSRGGVHPATFGKGDVTEPFLLRILGKRTFQFNDQNTTDSFVFARKFA